MKIPIHQRFITAGENIIATFGQAKLIARHDGKIVLQGGTASDVTEAREWISLFLHEAVPIRSAVGNLFERRALE